MKNVLFLISVLTLSSACGTPQTCDSSTCQGCCSSGVCMPGTASNSCGNGGANCVSCSKSTCVLGRCDPSGAGGGIAAGGGGGRTVGGGGGGGGGSSTAPSCIDAMECPYWYCECRTGPPVNSRHCVNHRCLDGAQSCPTSCANFSTCWLGTSSGGFPGGSNAGPSTCGSPGGGGGGATGGGGGASTCPYRDLGKGCSSGSECSSGLCYGTSPSYVCTMNCTTANDCPLHWVCEASSTGPSVCMIGSLSGTASTSTRCFGVTFSDLGAPCTSCQSKFCANSACSRRCDGAFDCPTGWRCGNPSGSFKYCYR